MRATILLAALILLAGCKIDIDRTVLLVGDSLMAQSVEEVSQELHFADDRGYFVFPDAVVGTAFAHVSIGSLYAPTRATQILAFARVDVVVISLGANDAKLNLDSGNYVSLADMVAAAGATIDSYAGRPIIWILPHDRVRTAWHTESTYPDIVTAIQTAAAGRSNVRLVRFDDYVRSQGLTMADICLSDDVHFTDQGNQLWAKMIHEELSSL